MKLKKFLKGSLAVALVFGSIGVLAGCGKDGNNDSAMQNENKQYQIYKLAVDSGYEGTYEEWLATIKGAKGDDGEDGHTPVIEIKNDGYWYVDGVSTGVVAKGDDGESGNDGSTWLTGTIAPNNANGKNGDFYFDTVAKKIYSKSNNVWELVSTIVDGENGSDGIGIASVVRSVDSQDSSIDIYTITYTDGTSYSIRLKNGIDGRDGETPIIAVNDGLLQWKYEDDNTWTTLFDLNLLKGEDGATWLTGEESPSASLGKNGDLYFDTSTKVVYVKESGIWKEKVDLDAKETISLENNVVYSGIYFENELEVIFDTVEDTQIVKSFKVNGEEIVASYSVSYLISENIVAFTIEGATDDDTVIVKYVVGEENKLSIYIDDEEKGLLKGVYYDYNTGMPCLTLADNKFALGYNNKAINGTWEVYSVFEDSDIGTLYTLKLESDDGLVMYVMSSYYQRICMVSFDFTSKTYTDESEVEYTINENSTFGYVLNKEGIEQRDAEIYLVEDDASILYVVNGEDKLIFDVLTGNVTLANIANMQFVGETIVINGDYYTVSDNGVLERVYNDFEVYRDNDTVITVNIWKNTLTVSNDIGTVLVAYSEFVCEGDLYSANVDGDEIKLTLDSETLEITNVEVKISNKVEDAASLVNYIRGGATNIRLEDNIDLESSLVIDSEVTINLNGYEISASSETIGDGVFHVVEGGKLTINGEGTVNGICESEYDMAIWADGGEVIINGGTYTNVGAGDYNQYDLIYVKNNGKVTINGGIFKSQTPRWTLNSHNTLKGTIVVNGGEFYEFNPSSADTDDNQIEGNPVSYIGEGYVAIETIGDNEEVWYIVVEDNNA